MPPNLPPSLPDASASSAAATGAGENFGLQAPGDARNCRVLVLYAHPNPAVSRVTRKLADAARLHDGVVLDDLYESYPDFYIDVARERALLSNAQALVLLFPTQWYAAPALLKEWFDVVLHDAWQVDRVKPAAGGIRRQCWVVTSTGSALDDYTPGRRHGRPLLDYLAPLEQTARVCGMQWLDPLVLYSAHDVGSAAVDAHLARFQAALAVLTGNTDARAASGDGIVRVPDSGAAHGN
ncbi:MAG: dehydrogenase [Massilia sp.]|nr:dehydrogenase [Massilia sp.]